MPIVYPSTRKDLLDRMKKDMQAELPASEPYLRNSYLNALLTGTCGGLFDNYKAIQSLQSDLMFDTTTGEALNRWANTIFGLSRLQSNYASGYLCITGISGTSVPSNTIFSSSDNIQYKTVSTVAISLININILSITRSGNVATVTTATSHNLADNITVNIFGADQSNYNGSKDITVTGANTFIFDVDNSTITPATGTMYLTCAFSSVQIQSLTNGYNTNQEAGTELFLSTPIAGVDTSAFVQYGGLTGGIDDESDANYRKRFLYYVQHPISYYNVATITLAVMSIQDITRVEVFPTTPTVGDVEVYCMTDNNVNPIPTPEKINEVKSYLDENIKPAHVDTADLHVYAPSPVITTFAFTLLSPNTTGMQNAISANLNAFFREQTNVGVSIKEEVYKAIIANSVDPSSGSFVEEYVLSSPLGDIHVDPGEIAILGDISYP